MTLSTLERRLVSFVIASIIMCINYLLKWMIKNVTAFENQRTHTEFNLSVAVKLTVARFVNSAIVPVIINIKSDRWFADGGLVFDVFSVMLMISIIDTFSQWLDPEFRLKKI